MLNPRIIVAILGLLGFHTTAYAANFPMLATNTTVGPFTVATGDTFTDSDPGSSPLWNHNETTLGGLSIVPGTGEVMSTSYNVSTTDAALARRQATLANNDKFASTTHLTNNFNKFL